jgi:selenocysteine-specific elongation factor
LGSPVPAYRQIANAFRALLVAGSFPVGEPLPTVRQLAVDLGVHHNTIAEAYRAGGLTPPDAATLAAACGAPARTIDSMTALLTREKLLARVDTLIFHAEALRKLKEEIAAMKAGGAGGRVTVDVATFKERYGVTRKFAIPLLEYLDRERVTRREGDLRVIL